MADDSNRTCVGCGEVDRPERFERFVWAPEFGLLHDLRGKAPGRGAYVHADPKCLERAAKSGFRRSFRSAVEAPPADELVAQMREAIRTRLDETARLAVRSQAASVGAKAVDELMKSNVAKAVFIASDAGGATRKKYASNAERKELPIIDAFTGAQMGGWCGHDFVAVMAVKGRLATRLLTDIENLERLGSVEG